MRFGGSTMTPLSHHECPNARQTPSGRHCCSNKRSDRWSMTNFERKRLMALSTRYEAIILEHWPVYLVISASGGHVRPVQGATSIDRARGPTRGVSPGFFKAG